MHDSALLRSARRLLDEYGVGALFALGNGMVAKTGAITYAARTITPPAAGITIANGNGVAGNPTLSLANDLAALEGLATTGLGVRSAADTWVTRSLVAPAAGITIANADGVAGAPTFALAGDLASIEALATTGLGVRSAADTWLTRSLVAPAAGITIANADGVAGAPTFALANDLAALEALAANGVAYRTGVDTWSQYIPCSMTLVAAAEAANARLVTMNLTDALGTALSRVQRCRAYLLDANGLQTVVGAWTLTIGGGGTAQSANVQPSVIFDTDANGDATINVIDVSGAAVTTVRLVVEPMSDGVGFTSGTTAVIALAFA